LPPDTKYCTVREPAMSVPISHVVAWRSKVPTPVITSFAVFVVPALSLTVYVTPVEGCEPFGTSTVNDLPSDAIIGGKSVLSEVTVYGAIPPNIWNCGALAPVAPFTPSTVCVSGWTVSPVVTKMSTGLPIATPAADAETVHMPPEGTTEGAVNVAVALPEVVCPKGSIEPHVAEKFTEVPSGAAVPVLNTTPAVMAEVLFTSTTVGKALRVEFAPEIVTGLRKSEKRSKALWLSTVAEAVMFRTVVVLVRPEGATCTTANASPRALVFPMIPLGNVTEQDDDPSLHSPPTLVL